MLGFFQPSLRRCGAGCRQWAETGNPLPSGGGELRPSPSLQPRGGEVSIAAAALSVNPDSASAEGWGKQGRERTGRKLSYSSREPG